MLQSQLHLAAVLDRPQLDLLGLEQGPQDQLASTCVVDAVLPQLDEHLQHPVDRELLHQVRHDLRGDRIL